VGLGSIKTYVKFGLPEIIRNGNRTSDSNCLSSVTQYNGSAHMNLTSVGIYSLFTGYTT